MRMITAMSSNDRGREKHARCGACARNDADPDPCDSQSTHAPGLRVSSAALEQETLMDVSSRVYAQADLGTGHLLLPAQLLKRGDGEAYFCGTQASPCRRYLSSQRQSFPE